MTSQPVKGTALDRSGSHTRAIAWAVVSYLALAVIFLWFALDRTGGQFVYAQDDPYIHLALARTLAEHGVWGIRPEAFASASSSPLWTLLLAGLWTLGAQQVWVPFVLNIVFGGAALVAAGHVLQQLAAVGPRGAPSIRVPPFAVMGGPILVTPLSTLAFIGMEHSLQVLLVLVFAWQCAVRLADERDDWLAPAGIAFLMVATRYESLFLVAVAVAILLWQGRWRAAATVGVMAALPVVAFAVYSVAHGGLVLPNSVLMKSGPERFATASRGITAVLQDWAAIGALFRRPALLGLLIAVLLALLMTPADRLARRPPAVWLAVLFASVSALHACLVKIDWFFRYDAYLMALGLVALTGLATHVTLPSGFSRRRGTSRHPALAPLLLVLALPIALRAATAAATTVPAVSSVFAQQVQLGRFFASHYPHRAIAVNDIGAVAWMSTSPILDIAGLASQPVADLRRLGAFDAGALEGLAATQGVEAIAVYEEIFVEVLPDSWAKVGEWRIENAVGVAGDRVSFLAPDAVRAGRLRAALAAFSAELPAEVVWSPNDVRLPARRRVRPPAR